MTLNETQDQIIEEFGALGDWEDRYQLLIDLGHGLAPIDPRKRTDQFLIKGCQSRVWLDAQLREGRIHYSADSDAMITKGIVALLVRVLNGRTPGEVVEADLYFIDRIGLKENLSPTRSNGLVSMVKQMRLFALAHKTRQESGGTTPS